MGGILSTVGAFLRVVGSLYQANNGLSSDGRNDVLVYLLVLFGQCSSAMSYPIYVNLVAALASDWFPIHERDMATAIASLFNPLGNALGQIIPPLVVKASSGICFFTTSSRL